MLLIVSVSAGWAVADETIDFNRDIRPLLSNRCLICHGPDEEERAADLRLDSLDGATMDLGGYAAIIPGDPAESELFVRITTDDPDLRMPPPENGNGFTEAEVDLIRRWIEQGAAYAKHWSYVPPKRPRLPPVRNPSWVRNPIDQFILSKLDEMDLKPSPEADRYTLARRLSLDLTGLPPTWEQVNAFANDTRENAYELFVDDLLSRPAYGERWARVWLDLARYADSAGYADDPPRTIWAYRDYVIRSLNQNKPFDQFTLEQIAGDLFDQPSDEQLVATAFHRNTLTNNEGGTNDEEFRNVAVVDRVNTTMAVWMGTTMACAQCHTHKYDPITHDEYFQFFAFFNQSEDSDKRDERPFLEVWSDNQREQQQDLRNEIDFLRRQLAAPNKEVDRDFVAWLSGFEKQPTWFPLKPDSANATNRELVIGQAGWIEAQGERPEQDDYEIQYPVDAQSIAALRLEVPKEQRDNFVVTSISASWVPSKQEPTKARFVRVELPGKDKMIHLAEIQVLSGGKNVAVKGKAKQSSTDYGGEARFVNDGNTNGDFNRRSVTHTARQADPWIEIDLGSSVPVEQVVVWNRTDGGSSISSRLKGFEIQLLDEARQVVWNQQPDDVPTPSLSWSPDGTISLPFSVAMADHQQNGFPAQSVLTDPSDRNRGWAVSPQQGRPHELSLFLEEPKQVDAGYLQIRIEHASVHTKHVLNHFRLSLTQDPDASKWAQVPKPIGTLIRKDPRSESDTQKLAEFHRGVTSVLDPLRKQLKKTEERLAAVRPMTTVPVMRQLPTNRRRLTNVQIRGNYQSKGNQVSEGTPAVFHPLPEDAPRNRLGLAHWLVDDANPLTARVIANRQWEQIFGRGIVVTSEEFGSQGELPTHPELLDWLAVELREGGWDLKQFLKLLVTSATYRQISRVTPELEQADPFNRFLARGARFRISAEMVRDQALFVSGLLSDKMYGKPVNPPQPELGLKAAFGSATDWKTSGGDDRYRRGLYTRWRRSSPYPSMAQFDAPNREVCTVRRIRTNTPLQALVTLNDPVYVEAAQSLAKRVIAQSDSTADQIAFAFRTCLLREPRSIEVERLESLIVDLKKSYLSDKEEALRMATQPGQKLTGEDDPVELATWTVVANVILNLDEMFLKR